MLSDTDKLIVDTIRMHLSTEQAMQYLKDNGFPVSRATYFRHKRKVEEKKLERLYHISKIGFVHQHLERIDHIEVALKEMWTNYILEKDIMRKVSILEKIVMVQPYLSSYYEATKYVVHNGSDKTELIHGHRISKLNQKNNSLIHDYETDNIKDLIRQEEEDKKEIDKKVFDKYNHDKNNFVV